MKTFLALSTVVVLFVTGCESSSERGARIKALERELATERQQIADLKAQLEAERRNLARAVTVIRSHVEDLDRTLSRAGAEIWGDGSSTGAQLSTAQRSMTSLQAELDSLVKQLQAPSRPP